MPKVKFNVNLGSRDATALDLVHAECVKDAVVDVTKEQLEGLKNIGPAVVTEDLGSAPKAAPKPAEPKP